MNENHFHQRLGRGVVIGIIGGSGFYDFLEGESIRRVETPYGSAQVACGTVEDRDTCFIARHGSQHSIAPSKINYRANIFAAQMMGVENIIASNAVGTLSTELKPGDLSLPDQILDFTSGREDTFFDGSEIFSFSAQNSHTDCSRPYSSHLSDLLVRSGKSLGREIRRGGTMVVTNGPRFETPAEVHAYRLLGGSYVGMTSAPEVFLSNELGIAYSSLAVITNYAAGLQAKITAEEVFELFKKNLSDIKLLLRETIKQF